MALSIGIACPALKPEWSSLQSDYVTSSFSAGWEKIGGAE
jgi:hypothetical protein